MRVMSKLIGTCYSPKEQLRQVLGTAAVSFQLNLPARISDNCLWPLDLAPSGLGMGRIAEMME